MSYYELAETFLSKKDFCQLVMKVTHKDQLWGNSNHDMTDDEFTRLQHLAHMALLADNFEFDLETYIRRTKDEN
jgi:hypothetical protein